METKSSGDVLESFVKRVVKERCVIDAPTLFVVISENNEYNDLMTSISYLVAIIGADVITTYCLKGKQSSRRFCDFADGCFFIRKNKRGTVEVEYLNANGSCFLELKSFTAKVGRICKMEL